MADGNGNATSNKQLIGWAIMGLSTLVLALLQWAVLGGITELRAKQDAIAVNLSALTMSVGDLRQDVTDNRNKEQDDVDKLWSVQREPRDPPQANGH